jgi:transcriptional regulator with XRE-family HTH domain
MAQNKRSSHEKVAPLATAPTGGRAASGGSRAAPPSPERAAVGPALCDLRTQRGLSLGDLAAQVGVSAAQLEAIEAGRAEPSIDLTWSLANALGTTFSALVSKRAEPRASEQPKRAEPRASEQPKRAEPRASEEKRASRARRTPHEVFAGAAPSASETATPSEAARTRPRSLSSRRALIPAPASQRGRSTEVHELKLAPHGLERASPQPHGTEETLLVTAGRVIVRCATEDLVLGVGDSHVFRGGSERFYLNPDETDAVLYAMVAPA